MLLVSPTPAFQGLLSLRWAEFHLMALCVCLPVGTCEYAVHMCWHMCVLYMHICIDACACMYMCVCICLCMCACGGFGSTEGLSSD